MTGGQVKKMPDKLKWFSFCQLSMSLSRIRNQICYYSHTTAEGNYCFCFSQWTKQEQQSSGRKSPHFRRGRKMFGQASIGITIGEKINSVTLQKCSHLLKHVFSFVVNIFLRRSAVVDHRLYKWTSELLRGREFINSNYFVLRFI